jgi:hypothetical protein
VHYYEATIGDADVKVDSVTEDRAYLLWSTTADSDYGESRNLVVLIKKDEYLYVVEYWYADASDPDKNSLFRDSAKTIVIQDLNL